MQKFIIDTHLKCFPLLISCSSFEWNFQFFIGGVRVSSFNNQFLLRDDSHTAHAYARIRAWVRIKVNFIKQKKKMKIQASSEEGDKKREKNVTMKNSNYLN